MVAYVARKSPKTALDDFPTPPWATRAFFKYVAPPDLSNGTTYRFMEPACGRGHMVRVIKEYGHEVVAFDIKNYKRGFEIGNYVDPFNYPIALKPHSVMMTNPPYKLANEFVEQALKQADLGVAILVRTLWVEGGRPNVVTSRWERILKNNKPNKIAIISARMPAAKGKVIKNKSVFMSHSWIWWDKRKKTRNTEFMWIPPEAQSELERPGDYS